MVPAYYWVIFLGYLGVLSLYYIYVYKKNSKTYEDFIIAGQNVPWYYVTGSLMATTISGALFLGSVGYVYNWGCVWYAIILGCLIAWFVISVFVGPRLRSVGVITLSQYFMERYNNNGLIKNLITWVVIVYMGIYLMSTFIAFGLVGTYIFHVNSTYMIIFMGASAMVLTAYSGQVGVFWTDLIQFIFFTAIMAFTGILFLQHPAVGGVTGMFANAEALKPGFFSFVGTRNWGFAVGLVLVWSLGYIGHPAYLSRYWAAKSVRHAVKASIAQPIIYFIFWYVLFLIAAAPLILIVNTPDGEMSYLLALEQLFPGGVLTPLVAAAIFAAGFSTINTFMMTAACAFMEDFYKPNNPGKTPEHYMTVTRAFVLTYGAVLIFLGLYRISFIMHIASWSVTFCASAIAIPLLGGLYWGKSNEHGTIITMLYAVVVAAILWALYIFKIFTAIDPMLPCVFSTAIVYYFATIATYKEKTLVPRSI